MSYTYCCYHVSPTLYHMEVHREIQRLKFSKSAILPTLFGWWLIRHLWNSSIERITKELTVPIAFLSNNSPAAIKSNVMFYFKMLCTSLISILYPLRAILIAVTMFHQIHTTWRYRGRYRGSKFQNPPFYLQFLADTLSVKFVYWTNYSRINSSIVAMQDVLKPLWLKFQR